MKKFNVVLIVLLLLCVIANIVFGVMVHINNSEKQTQEKYVLYVGIPENIDTSDVKAEITEICKKSLTDYTLVEGEGGFTDGDGDFVSEKTLIYTFCFTTEDKVKAVADQILKNIENSNILMETQQSYATHSTAW